MSLELPELIKYLNMFLNMDLKYSIILNSRIAPFASVPLRIFYVECNTVSYQMSQWSSAITFLNRDSILLLMPIIFIDCHSPLFGSLSFLLNAYPIWLFVLTPRHLSPTFVSSFYEARFKVAHGVSAIEKNILHTPKQPFVHLQIVFPSPL